MRLAVTVLAVSEDQLRSAAGSYSERLVTDIDDQHRALLRKIRWQSDAWDKIKSPFRRHTLRRAVRNIVFEQQSSLLKAGNYSLAYYLLCRRFSYESFEDWPTTIKCTSPWLKETAAATERFDLAIDFHKLFFRGPVIDFPVVETRGRGFGFWSAAEVKRYITDAVRFLDVDTHQNTNEYFLAYHAVASAYSWLSAAAKRVDGAVVAFYFDCPTS